MDFRVLGPFEVLCQGEPVQVAAGKQRTLLARLLLHANRTVSREQIVDALWSDDPPDTANKMVQIHVSQLRKALPEPRLHTRAPGYLLEIADDELDLARFDRAVAGGRQALLEEDPGRARTLLAEALGLWRGPALADIAEPFARHERARLEELRLAALEWRLEADLALGRHRELVGELEGVTSEHPLRERLRAQQMLALYRSGRQAEALAAFQTFRRMLADELGIEPSASLRELERRMLQQDPALEPAPAARRSGGRGCLRAQRGRAHRVPGRRLGTTRPRARPRLGLHLPARLGAPEAGVLLPPAGLAGPADPVRQARHGPVRPGLD